MNLAGITKYPPANGVGMEATKATTDCARSATVAACKSIDALLDWDDWNAVDAESLPEVA